MAISGLLQGLMGKQLATTYIFLKKQCFSKNKWQAKI